MSTLLKTPLESLNISPVIKGIVLLIHLFVRIFGVWKRPREKAAANFEKMSFIDKVYWAYKSKHLIKIPGKAISIEEFNKGTKYTRHEIEQKGPLITIGAVGDLIKNPLIQNSGDTLYGSISDDLFGKDISTANLESLLSERESGMYTFSTKNTPSLHCTGTQFNVLKAYNSQNYSVLSIINNHSLDEGLSAFYYTAEKLKQDGIIPIGINTSSEEQGKCVVLEKKGFKIGFISATYGLNGKEVPKGHEYAVNTEPFHNRTIATNNIENLENQLEDAKQKECDFIIAHLHWGYEYELYPRITQIKRARELAESGVDIIISHHPHVIQPYEIYTPESTPHKRALIAYSLGNLTSNYSAPGLTLSAILNVTLLAGMVEDKKGVYIHEVEFIPVVQTESEERGENTIRIMKLGELQNENKEIEEIMNKVFRL